MWRAFDVARAIEKEQNVFDFQSANDNWTPWQCTHERRKKTIDLSQTAWLSHVFPSSYDCYNDSVTKKSNRRLHVNISNKDMFWRKTNMFCWYKVQLCHAEYLCMSQKPHIHTVLNYMPKCFRTGHTSTSRFMFGSSLCGAGTMSWLSRIRPCNKKWVIGNRHVRFFTTFQGLLETWFFSMRLLFDICILLM